MIHGRHQIGRDGSYPDSEAILEADLRFAFGELLDFDAWTDPAVCDAEKAPNPVYLSLDWGRAAFTAGARYIELCALNAEAGIVRDQRARDALNHQQNRAVDATNFYRAHFSADCTYAFNWLDAQVVNYVDAFGAPNPVPCFQYHRFEGRQAILIVLPGYQGYPSPNIPEINDQQTFREKASTLFWRGGWTGTVFSGTHRENTWGLVDRVLRTGNIDQADFEKFTRFKFCVRLKDTDFADVGINRIYYSDEFGLSHDEVVEKLVPLQPYMKPSVTPQDQFGNRYILSIDGFDGPSNLYWTLSTNSLVFRQRSPWEMMGDNYFEPWVHFVPVESDASDVAEKFLWCENNIEQCERMIANAHAAWRVLFDKSMVQQRTERIFARYAADFRRKVKR
jgi:Glycosyl transferase family 90